MNLSWWDRRLPLLTRGDLRGNLGDMLSPVIVEFVAQDHGLSLVTPVSGTRHLAAIGSLIGTNFVAFGSCVWGTGYQPSYSRIHSPGCFRSLDIRAVRGPLTAEFLHGTGALSAPDRIPLGDPAVLLPLFHTPTRSGEGGEPLVLLHESDGANPEHSPSALTMSVLTEDWREVVDAIVSASLVISTSLHGIILAEAYGVPAIMVDSPNVDARVKFEDWYLSTGRPEHPVARSVTEALTLAPAALPDLSAMQHRLLDAFPVDLWE